MPCFNENCVSYHLVSLEELEAFQQDNNFIDVLLCDECRSRKNHFHTLQCLSCRTILDFIPTIDDEIPSIVYLEKCLSCGGTIEDEIKIINAVFKHLYVS